MQLTLLVCLTLLSFFSLLSYPLPSVPCYSHFLLFSIRFFSFSYSISSDYIRMFYKFSSSAFLPSVLASFTFLSCLSLHSLFPLSPPLLPPPSPFALISHVLTSSLSFFSCSHSHFVFSQDVFYMHNFVTLLLGHRIWKQLATLNRACKFFSFPLFFPLFHFTFLSIYLPFHFFSFPFLFCEFRVQASSSNH